jgi:hypothetical protein
MKTTLRLPAFVSLGLAATALTAAPRPADIPFRTLMIDPGTNETAAVADLNNDGLPDLISGDSWYEAPSWKKHPLRPLNYSRGYVDNFSDHPMDVDGDGYIDLLQFSYFARNIVWLKNPGPGGGGWTVNQIDSSGPTEFSFLVDLNNDGIAAELLPQFDRPEVPLAWFELVDGKWIKHVVSPRSYGHGIGAGDVNLDGRNDIITPAGWLEAPADVRAPGTWTFHPTDWNQHRIPPSGSTPATPVPGAPPARPAQFGFMYVVDINGDGRSDILTTMAHDYGVCWYESLADGTWAQRVIDNSWSQAHASVFVDLNGDGQRDLITGKRYLAHNGNDPGEREPLGLYWYEYRKDEAGAVEWIRHIVDYGQRMGGGMQIQVADLDGDGDLDLVSGGKSGLHIAENLTPSAASR